MPEQVPRKPSEQIIAHALPVALAVLTIALAMVPFWTLLSALLHDPIAIPEELLRPSRAMLFLRSIAVASLIALLATIMGLPIARVLIAQRTRSRVLLSALLICPIWLPPFMIYAAGNLLRAPDTLLGRAIIDFSTSSPDLRWVTIWLGYAIAVLGLALWAAPIAGVLIAAGLGFRSNLYDDMLALEPIGFLARLRFQLRLHRSLLLRAFMLIGVLMLGSAVPLHLAQLETWSIVIWRQLSEHPPEQWGRIWVSAIPVLIVAALGARLIGSFLRDAHTHSDTGAHRPGLSRAAWVTSVLILTFAVALPLIAMARSLDDPRSIALFWRMNTRAVLDSGLVALSVGFTALLIALLTAFALGSPSRTHQRIARISILVLCVLALVPGVLIGASIAQHGVLGLHHARLGPYWASLTRVAFLGSIIGALCAASESHDRRSVRVQIAGASLHAWCITSLPAFLFPLLATLPIATLVAMFEIEAAIMVRSPGSANLPQQLLSDLHYARLEQLSAAGVNLMLIGIVLALCGSLLFLASRRRTAGSSN